MAYEGYLLKVGSFVITGEYFVNVETYKAVIHGQDLDPYRDATGLLHRNALNHEVLGVTFETRENITNDKLAEFMGSIRANFTNALERKCTVSAFVPERDSYFTQDCYMPDPEFNIKVIDPKTNVIKYKPMTIEFIGY